MKRNELLRHLRRHGCLWKKMLLVATLVLASAGGQAQDIRQSALEWGSLPMALSSLQDWGTKQYQYSAREPGGKTTNVLGTVTLATDVTPDALLLRDTYHIAYKGTTLSLEMVHTCQKDKFLSATRIESTGAGDDEVSTFVATVANGKATVRSQNKRDTVRDLPPGTITSAALMRLVTLVPRTPGAVYSFEYWLESEEMNLKKGYLLTVLPPETITSGARQLPCTKFQLTGGGINPVYYWVTEDGTLQRVLMDDRKILELQESVSQ